MRLILNSPAYYSKEFGIDNEIYSMCQEISRIMRNKIYSEIVDTIGIVPIVEPKELIEKGKWKEKCKYDLKFRMVFVSKQIDYEAYIDADIKEKKKLVLDNILDSVKNIRKKSKFYFVRFRVDMTEFLESNILI